MFFGTRRAGRSAAPGHATLARPRAMDDTTAPSRSGVFANRSFTLLWTGALLSGLGSEAASMAMPLLVLALTGSPAKAGLIGLARSLGYPLAPIPAGVIADRVSRRWMLVACAAGRAAAFGSVALVLAVGRPPFWQLVVVAFVDAALWSASGIAERGLLPEVVGPGQLPDAVAMNEARTALGVVGGPPIGGALFQVARGLPFLADAASFGAVILAALGVRAPGDASRRAEPALARGLARVWSEVREGASWLWHQPFLRAGALLYAASNLTLGAVELLGVLVARHHHASSAAIGGAFAIVGAGGVLSAILANPLRRRLSPRMAVLSEPWFPVVFVPLLLLCHSAAAVGVAVALAVLPIPLSSSVVVGYRLTLAPDALRGRVQASAAFVSGSIAWAGPPVVGFLFQGAGETAAVLALTGWTVLVAVLATAGRGLRQIPEVRPARA
jgi:hypothetical protein